MRSLYLLLALALTACATSRPSPPPVALETARPTVPVPVAGDSTALARLDSVTVSTPPTWGQKVLAAVGLAPRAASTAIGKKSTVNYYYGPATVNNVDKKGQLAVNGSVTNTGKKSEPAVINSAGAKQNTAGANAQQTTTTGDNNRVDAKKQDTTQEAPGVGATLAKYFSQPLGWLLAAGVVVVVVVVWRKSKTPLV